MTKMEMIESLVRAGRAADIVLMLEGESPISNEDSEGAPDDRDLAKLWTMALYHLKFVAEFGDGAERQLKDGKWLSPFPHEFRAWLQAGAPGVSAADLERSIHAYPR